jgi:hypothetical protein
MSKDNIVYFYFTFDDTNRQDISAFLKSALAQLCPKETTLLQLDNLYQACSPDPPSVRALQNALLLALKSFCGAVSTPDLECEASIEQDTVDETDMSHTNMVLDGLDEVPFGSQRAAVLQFLGHISRLNLPWYIFLPQVDRNRTLRRRYLLTQNGLRFT